MGSLEAGVSYGFIATVNDGQGGTDTATVIVNVLASNDAPTFDSPSYSFTINQGVTGWLGNVSASDLDPDDVLTYSGGASGILINAAGGVVVATGTLLMPGTYTLTAQVSDGNGGTATSAVSVTVSPAVPGTNAAPEFEHDEFRIQISEGASDAIGRLRATDPEGQTLTYSADPDPTFVVTADGEIRIVEGATAAAGIYTFTATVRDPSGTADTATVTIEVLAENAVPEFSRESYEFEIDEGHAGNVGLLAATDADEDELTYSGGSGVFRVTSTGAVEVIAGAAAVAGTYSFNVDVDDGGGGTATATVTIVVRDLNDPPEFDLAGYRRRDDTRSSETSVDFFLDIGSLPVSRPE